MRLSKYYTGIITGLLLLITMCLPTASAYAQCPTSVDHITPNVEDEEKGDICLYSVDLEIDMSDPAELQGLRVLYRIFAYDCTGDDVSDEITFDISSMESSLHADLSGKVDFYDSYSATYGAVLEVVSPSSNITYDLAAGGNYMFQFYFYAPSCTDIYIDYHPVYDQRFYFDGNYCTYSNSGGVDTFTTGGICFEGNIEGICCDGPLALHSSIEIPVELIDKSANPDEIDDTDYIDENGDFCLQLCTENECGGLCSHTERVKPNYNDSKYCGVTLDDYARVLNYIDSNYCLPCKYSYFAADADRDGDIDHADASLIYDMAIQTTSSGDYWSFIQKDEYDNWGTGTVGDCTTPSFPLTYDEYVDYSLIPSAPISPDPDFYAIKLGDVDGSCHDCEEIEDLQIPEKIQELAVKPNPATSSIVVYNKKGLELVIFDAVGNRMLIEDNRSAEVSIDIGHFAPGLYFISSNDGQIVKIIKR